MNLENNKTKVKHVCKHAIIYTIWRQTWLMMNYAIDQSLFYSYKKFLILKYIKRYINIYINNQWFKIVWKLVLLINICTFVLRGIYSPTMSIEDFSWQMLRVKLKTSFTLNYNDMCQLHSVAFMAITQFFSFSESSCWWALGNKKWHQKSN